MRSDWLNAVFRSNLGNIFNGCFPCLCSRFTTFCNLLHDNAPRLTLWAASVLHDGIPPRLAQVTLTEPLRTPPSVTSEVQKSDRFRTGRVHGYTDPPCPLPADGPAPIYLYHSGEGAHCALSPVECRQCGLELAGVLREQLQVGVRGVCVCVECECVFDSVC